MTYTNSTSNARVDLELDLSEYLLLPLARRNLSSTPELRWKMEAKMTKLCGITCRIISCLKAYVNQTA